MRLPSLKAYSNSSRVLGKEKGGSSFFISSSRSIRDSKSGGEDKNDGDEASEQFKVIL